MTTFIRRGNTVDRAEGGTTGKEHDAGTARRDAAARKSTRQTTATTADVPPRLTDGGKGDACKNDVGRTDGGKGGSSKVTEARHERFLRVAPTAVSRVAALIGLITLLGVLMPHRVHSAHLLMPLLPGNARFAPEVVLTVSGLLLLRIATGLRRRKRAEWIIATGLCTAMLAAFLIAGLRRPVEAAITLVLLVVLIAARSRFTARADRHSRWFAVRVAVQLLVLDMVYGMVLLYLPHHVRGTVSFGDRLYEVLLSLVGNGGSIDLRGAHFEDIFHGTLVFLAVLTVAIPAILAVRTPAPRDELSLADEDRLHALLAKQGHRDSLGYFALRRDKSVVWSASGKAAVTYRVVCGVALISGDPLGDPEAWPGAIEEYRKLVEAAAWTPAVMGCSELGATVFRRELGLNALVLGDEAILSTKDFALEGRAMRGVRQACARVGRAGYVVSVRRVDDIGTDEVERLRTAAAQWRVDPVERGFSMALSRLGDVRDTGCVVVTAEKDGQLCGLLHFVPWGPAGLSLDLMRRDRGSDNGLNEFMIVAVMGACSELGIERVSLNFAVFRDALERGERIGAGPVLRGWRRLLLIASRWWQIDSLYRFNAKFQPEWVPRFISYPAARDIPRIALAAMEAEAFVVRPRVVQQLLGRG